MFTKAAPLFQSKVTYVYPDLLMKWTAQEKTYMGCDNANQPITD
jgi:hypothetical protein